MTDLEFCRVIVLRAKKKRRYGERTVKHHVIPVAASLDHLDWHLANLGNGGWTTQVMVSKFDHDCIHSNMDWHHGQCTINYNGSIQRECSI